MAIVFSDIVGSTPYFAHFGDAAGRQLDFDLLAAALPGTDGRIIDTVGDGAFLAFPTASKAVAGLIAFLRLAAVANEARGHQHQIQVRIGMHWGSVFTDGTAVSGDAVNLCYRVATSTEPCEVRLTRGLFLELERELRLNCHPLALNSLTYFTRNSAFKTDTAYGSPRFRSAVLTALWMALFSAPRISSMCFSLSRWD